MQIVLKPVTRKLLGDTWNSNERWNQSVGNKGGF